MRFSKIDSGLRWILIIAGIKLLFHLVLNAVDSYGFFRDEYYYLACADHLAFGYVDHPALSIFLLWIERGLLGDSLFAIRILPAFAGAVTVVFGGLIAREFGGCTFAQVLTALMIIAIPGFLGINSFYSMNSFDVLVWSIALYIVAMLANGGAAYYWYILGLVLGLGLMNKISVLWLSAGIFIGLITTRHRSMFKAPSPGRARLSHYCYFPRT